MYRGVLRTRVDQVYSRVLVMRRSGMAQLYRSRDVPGLVEMMRDAPPRRRLAVVAALREAGSPEAESALIDVLSNHDDPFVRRVAVEALAEIDSDRDAAPIIRALRSDGSVDAPSADEVIDAGLYRLRALDTVPALMVGLQCDNHTTRMMSARTLGELGDRRAASALAAAASDQRRGVRKAAREALEKTNAGGA